MAIMKKKAKKVEEKPEAKEEVKAPENKMVANTADVKADGIIIHCEEGDVVFKPRFLNQIVYEYLKQKGGKL